MLDSKIQAISFDVGGTLIHPWPSVGHIYAGAAAQHLHAELDPNELNRRFIATWRSRTNFEHTRSDWANLVDATFENLVPVPPSETFFPELYDAFSRPESWRVFDDVIPTLDHLASQGIPLAIISNWDERLRPLLKSLKLASYFETILISCEIYFAKPSNVIFDHAIRNLGTQAEAILHVGDSVAEDIQGARAAGLNTLLIDRLGTSEPGRITSLSEIISSLEGSNQS